jgi:hypothetical protein
MTLFLDTGKAFKIQLCSYCIDFDRFDSIEERDLFINMHGCELILAMNERIRIQLTRSLKRKFDKEQRLLNQPPKVPKEKAKRAPYKMSDESKSRKYEYNRTRYLNIKSGKHIPKSRANRTTPAPK